MAKGQRLILFAAIVAIFAVIGVIMWRQDDRADRAEAEAGLAAARTLTAVFERASALKVAELNGEAVAQSEASSLAGTLRNTQKTKAPYTVEYFVDLRELSPSAFRWNGDEKIMTVDIPEVTVGRPNVDMSRAQIEQEGLYISRGAGIEMQRTGSTRLAGAARRTANDPARIANAQESAREAVSRLVAVPLQVAGQDDVRVVVRLPGERKPAALATEQWDMSRPMSEVLAELRNRD